MIRDIIVGKVQEAVERAREQGLVPIETMPDITVEHPSNPENGDFATSLPLRLARATPHQSHQDSRRVGAPRPSQ